MLFFVARQELTAAGSYGAYLAVDAGRARRSARVEEEEMIGAKLGADDASLGGEREAAVALHSVLRVHKTGMLPRGVPPARSRALFARASHCSSLRSAVSACCLQEPCAFVSLCRGVDSADS
jgi:hypothetical protein